MSPRRALVAASIVLATACGISAVGEMIVDDGRGDGGGTDGSVNGDANGADGTVDDGGGLDADAEAGFDAQGKCLEVCEAGTCDAGTCVIDCDDASACQTKVVCPPGVACGIRCGDNACGGGVDCQQATACNIACKGTGSCNNQPMACSGSSCNVTCADNSCSAGIQCDASACNIQCLGGSSCNNQPIECRSGGNCTIGCEGANSCSSGVRCDAGSCSIRCAGGSTCNNQTVQCSAVTSCAIQCGSDGGGGGGKDSCSAAAVCTAGGSCQIICNADDTCLNQPIRAVAPNVDVRCLENNDCSAGVRVSGGDASVTCRHNGACGNTIFCDAGRCQAQCAAPEDPSAELCCASGSICVLDAAACNASNFKIGCP